MEKSFGNYLGSNVMLASKEELGRVQKEIELLSAEVSDDAFDRKIRKLLSESAYKEIADLQEELRVCFFFTVNQNGKMGLQLQHLILLLKVQEDPFFFFLRLGSRIC